MSPLSPLQNCLDQCPHPSSSPAPWCLLTIIIRITNWSSHMPSPLSPMLLVPCWLHGPPFLVLPALLFVPRLKILALRPSADLHPPSPPTSSLHQAAEHESTKGQVGTTEALRSLASAVPTVLLGNSFTFECPTSFSPIPCDWHSTVCIAMMTLNGSHK